MSSATTQPKDVASSRGIIGAVSAWFFAPVVAERLAALRVIVMGFSWIYLISRVSHLISFSHFPKSAFAPVGPVALLDAPLPPAAVIVLWAVSAASGLAAVLGAFYKLTGPIFALSLLWVTAYRNSWGMLFHTENLMVLHALIVAVSPAADAWSWDAKQGRSQARKSDFQQAGLYSWPIVAMSVITVITYLIAGVAKLRLAGLGWTSGYELRTHIAYDAVRKIELGSIYSPLARYVVPLKWLFPPLAWMTLAFELGAPLALLGRRFAIVWCVVAWGFHASVVALMAIVFAYPLSGCAFASFFEVERLPDLLQRLWGKLRRNKEHR